MPVVTLAEESKTQGDFYVPRFKIKVAGPSLPRDVLRDIHQLTYQTHIKWLGSFALTVSNWDADERKFTYVGEESTESLQTKPLHRLFDPRLHEVEVFMGYGSKLPLMLKGYFTTIEPNFPSSGASTLTV